MILDKIVENKRKEITQSKKAFPLHLLKRSLKKSSKGFLRSLSKKNLSLIAEIKRKSPSKGKFKNKFDLVSIIKEYEIANVDAVSILTDQIFFGGSLFDLKLAAKNTRLPILRKDFIIEDYQIYESRQYGADAILLIARLLDKKTIDRFIGIAKLYGMACLVEVHTKKELEMVLKTDAKIIGINNRDLNTLQIDLKNTISLLKYIPKRIIRVAESGYEKKKDIDQIREKVDAVLIGSSVMESKDKVMKINELMDRK